MKTIKIFAILGTCVVVAQCGAMNTPVGGQEVMSFASALKQISGQKVDTLSARFRRAGRTFDKGIQRTIDDVQGTMKRGSQRIQSTVQQGQQQVEKTAGQVKGAFQDAGKRLSTSVEKKRKSLEKGIKSIDKRLSGLLSTKKKPQASKGGRAVTAQKVLQAMTNAHTRSYSTGNLLTDKTDLNAWASYIKGLNNFIETQIEKNIGPLGISGTNGRLMRAAVKKMTEISDRLNAGLKFLRGYDYSNLSSSDRKTVMTSVNALGKFLKSLKAIQKSMIPKKGTFGVGGDRPNTVSTKKLLSNNALTLEVTIKKLAKDVQKV